jgi:hypothetical protein
MLAEKFFLVLEMLKSYASDGSPEQHRLERQQHQQLTAPDNSKSKARRVEPAGLRSVLTGRREPAGA